MNRPVIGALLALVALRAAAAPTEPGKAAKPPQQPSATPAPSGKSDPVSIRVRVPRDDPRFASAAAIAQGDVASVSLADDRFASLPLATVEDEVVTVDDLREVTALAHSERTEAKGAKMDFAALLDKLIGVRAIRVEARGMGLDDLDEVKQAIAANRDQLRLEALRRRAVAGVKPPPAAEVERRYKEAAREWKLRAVVLPKRDDAVALGAALAGGGDFAKLAAKAVEDRKAKGGDVRWMRVTAIAPVIAKQVRALAPGRTSAPIQVQEGWTLIRLEDSRVASDPALRAKIQKAAADEKAARVLESYYAGLKKKYAVIDTAALKRVSFDSPKPGFDALLKDKRVVARVQGSAPITIGDVAAEVARPLFHGIEAAQKEKRLDKDKGEALDSLVSKRIVVLEAARLELDASPELRRQMKTFETNLLFTTFVDRAVLPDVKVPDADIRAAYEKRKREFTYPPFYKLQGLAFADAKKAQAALKSLQGGTDFKWLTNNADGVVAPDARALVLDGSTISASQMPDDLRKVLTGVHQGESRLWDQAGQHFVVHVQSYTPEHVKPFEEVKDDVGKTVYADALKQKLEEWIAKLRAAHDVKVFLVSGK